MIFFLFRLPLSIVTDGHYMVFGPDLSFFLNAENILRMFERPSSEGCLRTTPQAGAFGDSPRLKGVQTSLVYFQRLERRRDQARRPYSARP